MTSLFPLMATELAQHFGKDPADIAPDTLLEALDIDSLAMMELMCVLEDEHGLYIPDDLTFLNANSTVAQAAAFIERAQQDRHRAAPAAEDQHTASAPATLA